jgi:hypothetical protein
MTIIAGFRCQDGIVVCADTQETFGSAKRNVPKLVFSHGPTLSAEQDRMINHDLILKSYAFTELSGTFSHTLQ